jgi:hypothetical protein
MQIALDASHHDLLNCGTVQSADVYQYSGGIQGYYKRNRHFQCSIETKLLII